MLHDVVIWNPPSPPARYGGTGRVTVQSRLTGQERSEEFTDADYVPVNTYAKPVRSFGSTDPAAAELAAGAPVRRVVGSGAARAAIELYSSIFNYRDPSPVSLSLRA